MEDVTLFDKMDLQMWLSEGSWDADIFFDYVDGPNVTTRVLVRVSERRCDVRSRGQSDVNTSFGDKSQSQVTNSLEPPEGIKLCQPFGYRTFDHQNYN